jgi:hypothetical protein
MDEFHRGISSTQFPEYEFQLHNCRIGHAADIQNCPSRAKYILYHIQQTVGSQNELFIERLRRVENPFVTCPDSLTI